MLFPLVAALLLVWGVAGCSAARLPVRVTVRRAWQPPTCSLERGEARCALGGASPRPIGAPFVIRAWAARRSGGVWLLGAEGQLVRVAKDGSVRGQWATEFWTIAATRDFLCGATSDGLVRCARDFREDSTCPGAQAPPGPFHQVPLTARALVGEVQGALLCARGLSTECIEITAICDGGCLALPACGPVRCAAPCARGSRSPGFRVKSAPSESVVLSSQSETRGT